MAKIVLYSLDVVGKSMAGPAIRYWEFAKTLSNKHEVILLTPNPCELVADGFTIMQGRDLPAGTEIIITQEISHKMAFQAKWRNIKIILDAYDPLPLEILEIFRQSDLTIRKHKQYQVVNRFNFSFQMADVVICANAKQRDLWMGLMLSLKKISPIYYDEDVSLRNLIDLVPFGLPSTPPTKSGEGLRKMFQLKATDKVLLWGGGIWNWFDPLTLIQAIKELSEERPEIKLVFMGVKHPNDEVPEMMMASEAVKLAKSLDLLDKQVFFNFGWTPYEERQNFLLEADIGISTHFEHLETQYAFRTRILDYLWAGLPMVVTTGDSFAELIEKERIGMAVPSQDAKALATAIRTILDDSILAEQMKQRIAEVRPRYYWDEVVKPLEHIVSHLEKVSQRRLSWRHLKSLASYYITNKSPFALMKKAILRVAFTTRT